MYNVDVKNELVAQLSESSTQLFDSVKDRYDLNTLMEDGSVSGVRDVIKNIQNIMIASIPEGISIPKVTMYVTASGDSTGSGIGIINIKVTNSLNSIKKFSFAVSLTKGKALSVAFDFLKNVYSILLVDELIESNLRRVNEVIHHACLEAGIEYVIRVVSPLGNEGKKIASLSDDEVTFVADDDAVLALDDIIVLLEGSTDEISEEVIQNHYNSLVEELSTVQTSVQLVGIHGGTLVSYVCSISKRVKPLTLIKKVCSKNVTKLNSTKDTIAYYSKGDTFALVAQRDGNKEVILSPFDVNTLCKVDVDVLSEIA